MTALTSRRSMCLGLVCLGIAAGTSTSRAIAGVRPFFRFSLREGWTGDGPSEYITRKAGPDDALRPTAGCPSHHAHPSTPAAAASAPPSSLFSFATTHRAAVRPRLLDSWSGDRPHHRRHDGSGLKHAAHRRRRPGLEGDLLPRRHRLLQEPSSATDDRIAPYHARVMGSPAE
jgi:hypothetical protein